MLGMGYIWDGWAIGCLYGTDACSYGRGRFCRIEKSWHYKKRSILPFSSFCLHIVDGRLGSFVFAFTKLFHTGRQMVLLHCIITYFFSHLSLLCCFLLETFGLVILLVLIFTERV